MRKLVRLLPFMDGEELKELALKIVNGEVKGVKLVILYPFLNSEDLNEIVELCIEKGLSKEVTTAIPFLSSKMIDKIYDGIREGKITDIKEQVLFPFIGKAKRKVMFDDLVKEATKNFEEGVKTDFDEEDIDIDIDIDED